MVKLCLKIFDEDSHEMTTEMEKAFETMRMKNRLKA
jgi:hypothetical protein